MMLAMMNLLLLPVAVVGFRLALVGFSEESRMFDRKVAGVALLLMAALYLGLYAVVS